MSKQNNVNPGQYQTAGREHTTGPDGGDIHEEQKQNLTQAKSKLQGQPGQSNFIPGEKPVGESGEKSKKP